MEDSYKVLLKGGVGEIEEKKSRFIANIAPVSSEEEAQEFIDGIKKKYWDARHNCSAFVIGSRGEMTRCSDDGEPSGTAGRPMLEVLTGSGIRNICVVVTRYFGGVLLGTGGLVRAYTQAVQEGIKNCEVGVMRQGIEAVASFEYPDLGKIQYILGNAGISPKDTAYTDKVAITFVAKTADYERLVNELVEGTAGRVKIEKKDEVLFVDKDNLQD